MFSRGTRMHHTGDSLANRAILMLYHHTGEIEFESQGSHPYALPCTKAQRLIYTIGEGLVYRVCQKFTSLDKTLLQSNCQLGSLSIEVHASLFMHHHSRFPFNPLLCMWLLYTKWITKAIRLPGTERKTWTMRCESLWKGSLRFNQIWTASVIQFT